MKTIQINVPASQLQSLIHTNATEISNLHSAIYHVKDILTTLYSSLESDKDKFTEEDYKYYAGATSHYKRLLSQFKRDLKNAVALQKSFKQALKGT